MLRSRPVLTATSALLRFQPVAKALGCGESKTPTSGMPMPASVASALTVSTSQRSSVLRGCSTTCVPVDRLAIHLEMSREMKEPAKPNTAQKISSAVRSRSTPLLARMPSTPSRLSVTLASAMMARLVARNSRMRIGTVLRK